MRIAIFLFAALVFSACDSSEPEECGLDVDNAVVTGEADGSAISASSTVLMAYEGCLADGTVFDSNQRAQFDVDRLIPGFQNGVIGMTVGQAKTFDVPPELGYGNQRVGQIPPNSTLTFRVKLLEIL